MTRTGILIHVYHLEAKGWEEMVWGDPENDQLGTLPKLVKLLLTESSDEPVSTILIYSGPSKRDGLSEGEYTKKYLLDHFDSLNAFPTLHKLLAPLASEDLHQLKTRLGSIIVGPENLNTLKEVQNAARDFKKHGVTKVTQLCVASHAPRCLQMQMLVRDEGLITHDQVWSVVVSDTYFSGSAPSDVVTFEPPHRGDDPMTKLEQTPPEVIKEYFKLDRYKKQHFIATAKKILKDYNDESL